MSLAVDATAVAVLLGDVFVSAKELIGELGGFVLCVCVGNKRSYREEVEGGVFLTSFFF